MAVECEGKRIETSEGIAADETWRPLVEAYAKHDAAQCGYCTPGQFTVAKYIIEKYGEPTEEQIRAELAGNICRCGTYSPPRAGHPGSRRRDRRRQLMGETSVRVA